MSAIRKVIFSIVLFQSVSCFGLNQFEKHDSTKFGSLPGYQIYAQYFNPFLISKFDYKINFGFKWHVHDRLYYKSHLIFRAYPGGSKYQIASFGPMLRFSLKKIDWIHFELSTSLAFVHRNYFHMVIYEVNSFGLGILAFPEVQFDIGNRFNISLSSNICPTISFDFKKLRPEFASATPPTNNFSTPIYVQSLPSIVVGFNIYLNKK